MSLMPQTPFQWFVPATTGTGLVPAAGYKAKFYSAGTTTPKAIYTDFNLVVPYPSPSNVAVLDAQGKALIYLGAGGYKMVVTDPYDSPVYSQDNIAGESSFGTGFVDSFADLAAVDATLNTYTYIGGYYAPGDGGEGMFYNLTSSDSSDGGYIQDSTFDPTKRWFRIPDENGDVRVASFGYCGSGTLTSALMAADYYAYNKGFRLRIRKSLALYTESVNLNSPYIIFESAAKLQGATGAQSILINGIVIADGWKLFDNFTAGMSLNNPKQESRPEWFGALSGADGGDPGANATAFAAWVSAGAGLFIVPPGSWPHTGTFSPDPNHETIFYGDVGSRIAGINFGAESLFTGNLSQNVTGNIVLDGFISATQESSFADINADNITATGSISGNAGNFTNAVQAGSASIDTSVFAGGSITSAVSITAGYGGATGFLQGLAGSSASTFKAAGNIFNSGAGDATIKGNALTSNGDSIRISTGGTFSGGGFTDLASRITVGGQNVITSGSGRNAPSSGSYFLEVVVTRTNTTTANCIGHITWTNIPSETQAIPYAGTATIDWSVDNIVTVILSGTTVVKSQIALRGDFYPIA